MDLIDRYAHQVGRRLPRRMRADVEQELRSSLQDALEERTVASEGEPTDEAVVGLLHELGPPAQLAESYLPERWLIGPSMMPAFRLTMKVCLIVLATLVVASFGLGLWRTTPTLADLGMALLRLVGSFLSNALPVLGAVVIVFALVERFGDRTTDAAVDWDPKTLPPVDDPDRASRGGLIAGAVVVVLAGVVLNLFPESIGSFARVGGETVFVPLLGPGLRAMMPLVNLGLAGVLIVNLAVLRAGRWRPLTRWLDLGTTVLFLAVMVRLATGHPLADWSAQQLAELGLAEDLADLYRVTVLPIVRSVTKVGLAAGALGFGVAAVVDLVEAIRSTLRG